MGEVLLLHGRMFDLCRDDIYAILSENKKSIDNEVILGTIRYPNTQTSGIRKEVVLVIGSKVKTRGDTVEAGKRSPPRQCSA